MPSPSKLASSLSSKFSLSDETLYRLTAYLGTLSGTDKALMFLQYAPLLLLPALPAMPVPSAKLPIRPRGLQQLRLSLQALSSAVGDSRILFRLFGIVPILAWHRRLQRQRQAKAARANDPSATKAGGGLAGALLSRADIPSLQVSAMLAFYPMEHIWYLASKGVYPLGHAKIFKVAIWSCRAWAAYVALSLVVLRRDQLALRKQATSLSPEELEDKKMSLGLRALTELSYLPLTAHWSLESGLWTSSWFTGLFGTLAAIGQLQSGWRATALPKGASKPAEVAAAAATKPSANAATEEVTAAVAAAEVKAKHETE